MEDMERKQSLAPLLWAENRALLDQLSEAESASLAKYVDEQNVEDVQAAIGSDQEIEQVLFWDGGGKFDDPAWQDLVPLNEPNRELWNQATALFLAKRKEAVACQRRSDLTLLSQFNPGLIFTGLTGALRCDESGRPDPDGACFQGVEFRLTGSIGEQANSLSVVGREAGGWEVMLGTPTSPGMRLNLGDGYSQLQVAQLLGRDLPKSGLSGSLRGLDGAPVECELKAVRKKVRQGLDSGLPTQARLHLGLEVSSAGDALSQAENIAQTIYKRLGLELEIASLARQYGNFHLVRNENFDSFMEAGEGCPGVVFLTATLECRRCRRELPLFKQMAARYPAVKFGLVNMNAPHANFHERVFGDMAGGDANRFVQTADGATPFTIVYTPEQGGGMAYRGHIATPKDQRPPSSQDVLALLDRHLPTA
ncbi:MAG: hypothetical protein KQI62_05765 [Deltaproteobacteria bacterium]|nr:hypothetical protein [Deltaproteobacteria bacterium]